MSKTFLTDNDPVLRYDAQMLTPEQQAQARENMGLTVFGAPYSSATEIIDISANGDESVKMYLFGTADGFDAVVSGAGAIADYTEDNRPYDVQKICRLHITKGVTSIGDYFMNGANNLKCLSFEDSTAVTHLGTRAFALTQVGGEYDFSGLTDTTLNRVFFDCRKLEGVTLNGNITEIAVSSFACCQSLRYVKNIASNGVVCALRDGVFQYCTSLESLDATPANTTLGNFVFLLTPINAKVGETETNLADARWKSKGALMCFAQNEWASEQLTAIRGVTSESVQFPVPEADNQGSEIYKQWGAFWNITRNGKDKHYGYNHCVYFSLFHIYNTLHPNAQYDTYYDFITREIAPRKIKVTQSLYDALHNSEVWDDLVALNEQYGTGVTYALGDEISATDLPISLKYEVVTHYEVGTAIWGVCEVLGWSAEEIGFAAGVQSGADVKRTILDNLANNKPTMMFIVGAGNEGHAAHSVAAIGYDSETDRLLIIDSADSFPADTIPLAYWCAFEALITPDERSRVFTFDFGEVVNMTAIDEKLGILMESVNSGYHTESGTIVLEEDMLPASGQSYFAYTVPCSNGAKLFDFHADDPTLAAIKATTGTPYYTAILGNRFAPKITDNGGNMIGLLMHMREDIIDGTNYGWRPSNSTSFIKTTDGGVKFACYALKKGTYHWTAYYWNE